MSKQIVNGTKLIPYRWHFECILFPWAESDSDFANLIILIGYLKIKLLQFGLQKGCLTLGQGLIIFGVKGNQQLFPFNEGYLLVEPLP